MKSKIIGLFFLFFSIQSDASEIYDHASIWTGVNSIGTEIGYAIGVASPCFFDGPVFSFQWGRNKLGNTSYQNLQVGLISRLMKNEDFIINFKLLNFWVPPSQVSTLFHFNSSSTRLI